MSTAHGFAVRTVEYVVVVAFAVSVGIATTYLAQYDYAILVEKSKPGFSSNTKRGYRLDKVDVLKNVCRKLRPKQNVTFPIESRNELL